MTKVVFSRTLEPTGDRVVVQGDIAADLALRLLEAKVFDGGAVVLRYAALRS